MVHGLIPKMGGKVGEIKHAQKERAVLQSFLVDLALIIPDIIAAVMAGSITMYADVLKCANELLATFFSYLTLRKISRGKSGQYDYGLGKLENLTSIIVGAAMLISLLIVLYTGVQRLWFPVSLHSGGVGLGILFMFIGVCTNTWLWIKNYKIAKQEHSPIMESQWRLFRTKAMSDFTVFVALVSTLALESYWWSVYIDPVASFLISGFLMFSLYGVVTNSVYDLLDKSLEESLQMIIVRELVIFFDEYKALHGVRSRRSGGNIYIEIFLEFNPDWKMAQVQDSINRMKESLENSITGSTVVIALSPWSGH